MSLKVSWLIVGEWAGDSRPGGQPRGSSGVRLESRWTSLAICAQLDSGEVPTCATFPLPPTHTHTPPHHRCTRCVPRLAATPTPARENISVNRKWDTCLWMMVMFKVEGHTHSHCQRRWRRSNGHSDDLGERSPMSGLLTTSFFLPPSLCWKKEHIYI